MSNLFSRACTLFVVFGALGIGACASPSGPSAIPSGNQTPGAELGQPSPRAVVSGLTASSALSQGVTDATLMNAGWSCRAPAPGVTICAPPGLGFPSIPPIPNNGGAPSYTLMAFVNHEFDHHVKYLRPDLYQGQPCLGGDPWQLFPLVNYYHCIIPVR
jgi:hypothetical protein